MNQVDYEKQKLRIAEMELEVEKQKLKLMCLERVRQIPPVKLPTLKLDKVNFCKTNSKPYIIGKVTSTGVIYTTAGYRLKLNINELIELKRKLPNLLKKRDTPHFWKIIGDKYNVSANCIERIIYNLLNGSFDKIIKDWENYHIQYNEYGEIKVRE